jgi:hypothetical protein
MEYRKTLTAIGVLASLAALSACTSSGSPVSPNSDNSNTSALQTQISNDVAASTGEGVVSDIDETGNDGGDASSAYAAVGLTPRGLTAQGVLLSAMGGMGSSSCTQTGLPSDLRYYCTPDTLAISNSSGTRADTLIRQWNYEFFAEDTAQSHMDAYTDSINFGGANGVLVYAAVHRARWHGVSHRIRNHSATDEPSFAKDTLKQTTWNGNTQATDTASFTGTVWSVDYNGVAHDTTADVIFQRPRGENPFPLSGQFHRWVTWNYSAQGPSTASGTVTRHIVVTYNGTDTATLQVLGATTLTCSVDLVTGDVFDCH